MSGKEGFYAINIEDVELTWLIHEGEPRGQEDVCVCVCARVCVYGKTERDFTELAHDCGG